MQRNDQNIPVQKLRTRYIKKENTAPNKLRAPIGSVKHIPLTSTYIFCIIGITPVALACPIHNRIIKKEREKIAPEILRLTDELMK